MLELNKEYTYKDICFELGWKLQTGNNRTKQNQIKCIEESYKFYHPMNKKTQKEKKGYVFTKQIKEPLLEDGRKNNGGFRNGSGKKSLIPEEEFDCLWREMVFEAYRRNKYHERSWYIKIYFTNTLLFEMFGFPYGKNLGKIEFDKNDELVKNMFQDIIYEALKANTITKLCKRYGFTKNALPKGILRSQSKNRLEKLVDDDQLLDLYNQYEAEELQTFNCKSIIDAVRKGCYSEIYENIQAKFKLKRKYKVQRMNVICVNDIDFSANGERFDDPKLILGYRKHFRQVILDSVKKSCINRIESNKKYKVKLNNKQKQLLRNYLDQLLS